MLIYKRPNNLVFDTENPEIIRPKFIPPLDLKDHPLIHETTKMMTHDFLSQFFKSETKRQHLIFEDFSQSYYYIIK